METPAEYLSVASDTPHEQLRCGSCGEVIYPGETDRRHFGWFQSHSEKRCIEILRDRIRASEARTQRLNAALLRYAYRFAGIHDTEDCPEDDTCTCAFVAEVNDLLKPEG